MKRHFQVGDRVLIKKSGSDQIQEIRDMINLEFYVYRVYSDGGACIKDNTGFGWFFDEDELKLIAPAGTEVETISSILHRAADDHLAIGYCKFGQAYASCVAIWYAIDGTPENDNPSYDFTESKRDPQFLRVMNFLDKVCGLSEKQRREGQFRGNGWGERQEVRYAWLKACAMLAEEYNQ